MMERDRRIQQITGVFHEYTAARIAVRLLEDRLRANPAFLKSWGMRGRVGNDLTRNLEATYFIRQFAEFEAGLRDAWRQAFHRETEPPMHALLDAVAALRFISLRWLADVHRVRDYRNSLVHQGKHDAGPVPILEAKESLCQFFSKLPGRW